MTITERTNTEVTVERAAKVATIQRDVKIADWWIALDSDEAFRQSHLDASSVLRTPASREALQKALESQGYTVTVLEPAR